MASSTWSLPFDPNGTMERTLQSLERSTESGSSRGMPQVYRANSAPGTSSAVPWL